VYDFYNKYNIRAFTPQPQGVTQHTRRAEYAA